MIGLRPRVQVILAVLLTVLACDTSLNSRTTLSPTGPGFNILIAAEGDVRLKREGWSDYHLTTFGAVLHRGDLLRVANGARAVFLCDDLNARTVPNGEAVGLTNTCPQPTEPMLVRGESKIGSTRGGSDPLIPFIVSPRKTKLLSGTPVLRWNAVPGVTGYTVRVRGEGLNWEVETNATEIAYPGEPRLRPGVTYLLIIEADNGRSSQDEGVAGLGFSLLNENEAQRVRAGAEQLSKLGLTTEAEAFALARLYAGQGLIAEAIEALEALVDDGSQAAAVHRTLGDLYQQIELNLPAENHYLRAIDLAASARDIEGQAAAQAGLGEVYAALGNVDEAISRLTQARAGYETLGDTQHASELEKRLAELNP